MKRLVRVNSEVKNDERLKQVIDILDKISICSVELKDNYYELFEELNKLFDEYPDLYKQIEMVVKLPSNEDAKNVVEFNLDLQRILDNLSDIKYLKGYINNKPVVNEIEE